MSMLSQFFGGGGSRKVQVFTESGTWIKSDGVEAVDVLVVGAGGGGGARYSTSGQSKGADGGASSFSVVRASGGGGGGSATSTSLAAGGSGGGLLGGVTGTNGTQNGKGTNFCVGGGAGASYQTIEQSYPGAAIGFAAANGIYSSGSGGSSYGPGAYSGLSLGKPGASALPNSGGGGQGGRNSYYAGGGGGGEINTRFSLPVSGNVSVIVGAGGAGATSDNAAVGGSGGSGLVIVVWNE